MLSHLDVFLNFESEGKHCEIDMKHTGAREIKHIRTTIICFPFFFVLSANIPFHFFWLLEAFFVYQALAYSSHANVSLTFSQRYFSTSRVNYVTKDGCCENKRKPDVSKGVDACFIRSLLTMSNHEKGVAETAPNQLH